MNTEKVAGYYDTLWADLDKKGLSKPNLRHYKIMSFLKKIDFPTNGNILEVGCGIGTLTAMLAKKYSNAKITAVDLSPETIELARHKHKSYSNINFSVSDMSDWESSVKFDLIVLPDVIEHIPAAQHDDLFSRLAKVSHQDTQLFIHVPHPLALEYFHQHRQELLQIIDQPIHLNFLSSIVYKHNFIIQNVTSYALGFNSEDYMAVFIRHKNFTRNYSEKSKMQILIDRLQTKFL